MISYEYVPIGPWFSTTKLPASPVPPTNVCTWVLWWSSTVQVSAPAASAPSSGSVAEPWNVTVWPGQTGVPSAGDVIVGVGGVLPTMIVTVAVDDRPACVGDRQARE